MLNAVPPILLFLAKHPVVDEFNLSNVHLVLTGAAPCGKELVEELEGRFKKNNLKLMQGYGLSESGLACHLPTVDTKPGSVGKPAATFEMKIVDVETGAELGPEEKGEICLRSPCVMEGYLGKPEITKECFSDGWFHTGDIGYADENGETYVIDRKKELIKVKGLQVAPAELEDLLLTNPHVSDVAVIGIPCERNGEAPKAFVVRKDEGVTEQVIQEYVQARLSKHKWLTGGVEFVKEIPKSPAGKILRRLLRDQELKKNNN